MSAGIAFVVGYVVRVTALYEAWEEPLAKEPTGVYKHDDGRPMLGRKLKGKSKRELDYLGLKVHKDEGEARPSAPNQERTADHPASRAQRKPTLPAEVSGVLPWRAATL